MSRGLTIRFCYGESNFPPWQSYDASSATQIGGLFYGVTSALREREGWNMTMHGRSLTKWVGMGLGGNLSFGQTLGEWLHDGCDFVVGFYETDSCDGVCPGLRASIPFYSSEMNVLIVKERDGADFFRIMLPFEARLRFEPSTATHGSHGSYGSRGHLLEEDMERQETWSIVVTMAP